MHRPVKFTWLAALLGLACISLIGCSDGANKQAQDPRTSPVPNTPPPKYTANHIEKSLLSPTEIGSKMKPLDPRVQGLREGKAPSCYLSSISLSGEPEIIIRQFTTPDGNTYGANFARLTATYKDITAATRAYEEVHSKATSCPKKHRTKSRKLPNKRVTLSHDDTWSIREGQILGWRHVRGVEKNTYPPSSSIINVYHIYFDYVVRGNVIVSSVYWKRTKPSQPAAPIEKEATEILTKQLQKIG